MSRSLSGRWIFRCSLLCCSNNTWYNPVCPKKAFDILLLGLWLVRLDFEGKLSCQLGIWETPNCEWHNESAAYSRVHKEKVLATENLPDAKFFGKCNVESRVEPYDTVYPLSILGCNSHLQLGSIVSLLDKCFSCQNEGSLLVCPKIKKLGCCSSNHSLRSTIAFANVPSSHQYLTSFCIRQNFSCKLPCWSSDTEVDFVHLKDDFEILCFGLEVDEAVLWWEKTMSTGDTR